MKRQTDLSRRSLMRLFRTLRSKLVAVFLAPTLLIILLYGSLAHFASRQGLEDELGERLVSIGQTLSAEMSEDFEARQLVRLEADKRRVLQRLQETLHAARDRTNVRRIFIFDRDLRALVDSEGEMSFGEQLYSLEADRIELERTFEKGKPTTSVLFTGDDGRRYKTGYVPIFLEEEVIAAVGVEASAGYFDLLTDFTTVLTVLGAVGILLVIIVGTVFARRLTRPLNQLVDAAQRVGRGELAEPVVDLDEEAGDTDDEIVFLSRSFEEMRRDLVDRDRRMQMMLSGIAHEVRNPLGGMELFCGLLEEDIRDAEDATTREEKLEKVAKIKRELTYLERVVKDFLDFARDVPLELERFSAAEFLDEVDGLLGRETGDAGCDLRIDVDPPDVEVTADRQKLRRAVINVVRNAYQACSGDGEIELTVVEEGDDRLVTVRDDGPGIPEDKIEEILTPFFTTKEKGSGLGLSLTVQIIEQHGGEMTIESPEEGGTIVAFRLPFDPDVEPSDPEIPEGWLG